MAAGWAASRAMLVAAGLGAAEGPMPPGLWVGVGVGVGLGVLWVGVGVGVGLGVRWVGLGELWVGLGRVLDLGFGLQLVAGVGRAGVGVGRVARPDVDERLPPEPLTAGLCPWPPEWFGWLGEKAELAAQIICCGSPAERAKPPAAPITAAAPKALPAPNVSWRDISHPSRSILIASTRPTTAV